MRNIFSDILAKISKRRKKKGKPQPVVPEPPIKAVTYNRCDGHVSGGLLQAGVIHETKPPLQQTPKGAYWDQEAKVYKGTNYHAQAPGVDEMMRRRESEARRLRRDRDGHVGSNVTYYAESTVFDPAFFHLSEETGPERGYNDTKSGSGYDYTHQTVSSSYEPSGTLYEAPAYSAPSSTSDSSSSYTSTDSGGGGYSGGSE
jgi:hypothetical protein